MVLRNDDISQAMCTKNNNNLTVKHQTVDASSQEERNVPYTSDAGAGNTPSHCPMFTCAQTVRLCKELIN